MNVPAESPTIRARIAARAVDYAILGVAGWALGSITGFGFGWLTGVALLVLAYFTLMDARAGATLGKAALGLRVVDADGGKPSIKAALAREWFVALGAVPFVGPLLALVTWTTLYFTIRYSPQGQGWHDRLAGGTRVVRRRTVRGESLLLGLAAPRLER